MSFIHQFTIKDLSLCDKIIEYHKNHKEYKKLGTVHDKFGKIKIDKEAKDSVDVTFWPATQEP